MSSSTTATTGQAAAAASVAARQDAAKALRLCLSQDENISACSISVLMDYKIKLELINRQLPKESPERAKIDHLDHQAIVGIATMEAAKAKTKPEQQRAAKSVEEKLENINIGI